MTTEALKDHITQLREWADGNRLGGGMGGGLHAEKWPSLTPGARSTLAEHVTWLEQALAELEAAQQWRPMETAPMTNERIIVWPRKGQPDVVVYFAGDRWAGGRSDYFTPQLIAWLPLPEPPKEGT